ncbi:putative TM2 domain-containing protein [Halotydeus destructor]|nr:putative TM2 domain-containing protein [Halotydeus destructor]
MKLFTVLSSFNLLMVVTAAAQNDSSSTLVENQAQFSVNCTKLLPGQYSCDKVLIDTNTQEPLGCTKQNLAPVNCTLNDGLECAPGTQGPFANNMFTMYLECNWTNGYSFETSLLLSIFLGMFGVDRFYLGYPALGLLKFCTLGFLFFGQLLDIVLIAMQIVKPADGSSYVIKYFGPRLTILSRDNSSYLVPQSDW